MLRSWFLVRQAAQTASNMASPAQTDTQISRAVQRSGEGLTVPQIHDLNPRPFISTADLPNASPRERTRRPSHPQAATSSSNTPGAPSLTRCDSHGAIVKYYIGPKGASFRLGRRPCLTRNDADLLPKLHRQLAQRRVIGGVPAQPQGPFSKPDMVHQERVGLGIGGLGKRPAMQDPRRSLAPVKSAAQVQPMLACRLNGR